jgi:hypothetical protein
MPLDPDTEIQYRRGGKIMKKTPRKFQAGGAATPAPSPDRVPPAEAAKMKAEKEQQRREAATQKKGAEKPDLSKPFKKGGAVRKFADGGETQAGDKDIYYTGRFKGEDGDDIYRRAYEQADRLREPSGAEVKEVKARTGLTEPSVRKPAPKAAAPKPVAPKPVASKPEPKVEPKAAAKTEAPKSTGATGSYEAKGPEKDFERAGKTWEAVKALGRRMLTTPSGQSVSKFAKGGGVEAKGKTKGKIVKMAKGGAVRGYGVSKVTNKTKIV